MPHQHQLHVNGIEIAVFEWGEPQVGQPSILFAHANSFHARVWDQVIANLPGYHCFALDLRGHGRSSQVAPPQDWRPFAEDVIAVGQQLGLRGAVGVGHSLGGHAVTLAAAYQPELFGHLLLVDPVIFPPENYVGVLDIGQFAARRRNQWQSSDEMFERFKDRPPFNLWKPEVLRDYVDYALLPNPNGDGFVLACTPEFEAAIYNLSTASNIYPEIATIQTPVTILRAAEPATSESFDFSASPTAPDLAHHFPHSTDVALSGYTHFIPMQAPELIAQYIRDIVASL
jgi:pimeloyl-ACP methyl ester carboxylesterase